ncbi:MAG TPA: hypothetical protein VGM86_21195, partial [Thermoanaerobaculia bacterium]
TFGGVIVLLFALAVVLVARSRKRTQKRLKEEKRIQRELQEESGERAAIDDVRRRLLESGLDADDTKYLLDRHDHHGISYLLRMEHSTLRVLALECGWNSEMLSIITNCSSIQMCSVQASGEGMVMVADRLKEDLKYPQNHWIPGAEYWEYRPSADQGTYVAGGGWKFEGYRDEAWLRRLATNAINTLSKIDPDRVRRLAAFSQGLGQKPPNTPLQPIAEKRGG